MEQKKIVCFIFVFRSGKFVQGVDRFHLISIPAHQSKKKKKKVMLNIVSAFTAD